MLVVLVMTRMCLFVLTRALRVMMSLATRVRRMQIVISALGFQSATPQFQDAEAVLLTRNVWVSMALRGLCAISPTVSASTAWHLQIARRRLPRCAPLGMCAKRVALMTTIAPSSALLLATAMSGLARV